MTALIGTAEERTRLTRRVFAGAMGMLITIGRPRPTHADTTVEDWRGQRPGGRGIPSNWEAYRTPGGEPAYDFSIVDVDGRRALRIASRGDRSTIARPVQVDLGGTPALEWSWKVTRLPAQADVRRSATSDSAAQLLVVWPRPPQLLRSRIIAYAWDTTAPADSIVPSRKAGTVTFVVVRSGTAGLGRWLPERRNVLADYRRIYGEEPDPVRAVAVSIDTNDTQSPAEAYIGPIVFRRA
jgi:hypothetical protein